MVYNDNSGFGGHKIVREQEKRQGDWLVIIVIQESDDGGLKWWVIPEDGEKREN